MSQTKAISRESLERLEQATGREGEEAIEFATAVVDELVNSQEVYEWSTD